jgi:hypothetical protein
MSLPCPAASGTLLEVFRGDTAVFDVRAWRDDGHLDLTAVGVKAWFTLKTTPHAADADATLALSLAAGGLALIDAVNGYLRLTLSAAQTALLNPRTTYFWDIQIKDGSGQIFTPEGLWGELRVLADRTRATS